MLSIYFGDLGRVIRNWATLVILGGLAVLPSLYAWFNILASWDPYGNTGQLPVAVANQDVGATILGKHFNVGDQIVTELKHNRKIGWTFVSANQAIDGVKRGPITHVS